MVSAAVLKKPFAISGAQTGWVAETDARPQTTAPQLAELSFPTMELYAMPAATNTLLDDAAVDIDRWIGEEVEQAFAAQESAAFVNGDGSAKPKGFMTYPTVDESVWAWGSVGTVSSGADGALRGGDGGRRAARSRLCAEGGLPAERQLRDEPSDPGDGAQAEGRRRQLPLAAACGGRGAGDADGLPAGRGRGHAGRRRRTRRPSPSAISPRSTWSSTGRACGSCAIPIPPSPTSSSTRPSGSAAASRTSTPPSSSTSPPDEPVERVTERPGDDVRPFSHSGGGDS